MDISVTNQAATDVDVDVLVVNLFEGITSPGGATAAVDEALGGLISQLISDGEIRGKSGETTLIHTPDHAYQGFAPRRVLVAGLGSRDSFSVGSIRAVSASAARRARSTGAKSAATIVHGAGVDGFDPEACAEAVIEGSLLGLYRFNKYKSGSDDSTSRELSSLSLVEIDSARIAALQAGLARGRIFGDAGARARDLVNEPPNWLTPTRLAELASDLAASAGLECEILEEADCEELGMGAFVGVAKGSEQPLKFIHLTYSGDPNHPANDLWLIGKGITFDSGGLALKPLSGMQNMKGDMGGGATVIAAIGAIAELKPPINVHAVVAATENMPGGKAQRPGDVVQAMGGKWVEVQNPDAEGRLTLADAIGFARSRNASHIVDVATLTGAITTALGHGQSGVFGKNGDLVDKAIEAGGKRGEVMWRLPLDEVSKRQNRSRVADLRNTGGRPAGSISAAHFIAEFVGDTPWVHIDIAGTYTTESTSGVNVPGATGVPARALVQLALDLCD